MFWSRGSNSPGDCFGFFAEDDPTSSSRRSMILEVSRFRGIDWELPAAGRREDEAAGMAEFSLASIADRLGLVKADGALEVEAIEF